MPARKRAQRAAVTVSLPQGELADGVEQTCPRTLKPIDSNKSRQARSLSASSWRSLARVVPQEDWQDL